MIILSLEQWVLIVYKSIFLLSLEQRVCFIHLVLSTPPDLDKEVITFITENDISRYGMAY